MKMFNWAISMKIFAITVIINFILFYYLATGGSINDIVSLPLAQRNYGLKNRPTNNKTVNDIHNFKVKSNNSISILDSVKETLHNIKNAIVNKVRRKKWHELEDKFERLNENEIYKHFNIKKKENRPSLNVIFIVSSAPKRLNRRMAIRETWWQDCKSSKRLSIKCMFLTDKKERKFPIGKALLEEAKTYGDLYFQDLQGGYDFGKRFLFHMVWAMQNYKFDYFIRLDDDYFMCMHKFVQQIPMPPKPLYHWGWVHCITDIVRPEESVILLSKDVMEAFLGQDSNKILCNRWADQMIGVWNEELKLPKFYHHDSRLHHDPPAQYIKRFQTEKNICTKYIGIHGSYPAQMRILWKHRGKDFQSLKTFDDYAFPCSQDSVMKWQNFMPLWHSEPKLCKTNPDWGGFHGSAYAGRQGAR